MPAREHARCVGAATACVWALTAFGVLMARLAPALAPSAHPHPTLHGTLGELASVIANNLRVLAAPFLLTVFRWPSGRLTRRLGDLLIVALMQRTRSRWGSLSAAGATGCCHTCRSSPSNGPPLASPARPG